MARLLQLRFIKDDERRFLSQLSVYPALVGLVVLAPFSSLPSEENTPFGLTSPYWWIWAAVIGVLGLCTWLVYELGKDDRNGDVRIMFVFPYFITAVVVGLSLGATVGDLF